MPDFLKDRFILGGFVGIFFTALFLTLGRISNNSKSRLPVVERSSLTTIPLSPENDPCIDNLRGLLASSQAEANYLRTELEKIKQISPYISPKSVPTDSLPTNILSRINSIESRISAIENKIKQINN